MTVKYWERGNFKRAKTKLFKIPRLKKYKRMEVLEEKKNIMKKLSNHTFFSSYRESDDNQSKSYQEGTDTNKD